jgi:hypothetical protein
MVLPPSTIVSASASLLGTCHRLSVSINTLVNKVKPVDNDIGVLRSEIDNLPGVLGSINTEFKKSKITGAASGVLLPDEEECWANARRSMSNCEEALTSLDKLLSKVQQGKIFSPSQHTMQNRLQANSVEIGHCQQQIAVYSRTMSLFLQLIQLYVHHFSRLS